ncbi:hypothetical protein [Bacteroides sp. UBA939]|uniref:hypothetical protein n=1 Tax=Bacteroides sp. UBA939 TaxID=1946092 RepID=UPI0025C45C7E|nr:hypothetical protein [Bacteroides sp. UBA939]
MNTLFRNILVKESKNSASVHLYYSAESGIWKAYEQSALRLMRLLLLPRTALHDENISGTYILRCVDVDLKRKEHNAILKHCIAMGDDYMELAV